jgi:hypothetical protein
LFTKDAPIHLFINALGKTPFHRQPTEGAFDLSLACDFPPDLVNHSQLTCRVLDGHTVYARSKQMNLVGANVF